METRWNVEVKRFFIETKQRTKKGTPVMVPVTVRKLELYGDFITTDGFICTLVKRHGERYISVKQRVKPVRAWWDKTPIKANEIKWKKYSNYTLEKFEEWLSKHFHNASAIVSEMLTAPPENIAA